MPLIAQRRNASMQALNGADLLPVDNKNFAAEWYDHAGGQAFIVGGGPYTLNLDTEKVNSAPTVYVMAADILTLVDAGLYLFSFQLMLSSNGNGVTHAWLEQDPATGVFSTTLSSVTYFPTPAINGISTGTVTAILRAGINYRYRVRYEQSHGSTPCTTVADGSKLTVMRLFKNG